MQPQERMSYVFRRSVIASLAVVSVLIVTYALYLLRNVALIVAFGGFVAYFLAWPIGWLTRRKMPYRAAVRLVCYTSLLLVLGILGPMGTTLFNQVQSFITTVPGLLQTLELEINRSSLPMFQGYELNISSYVDQVITQMQQSAPEIARNLVNYTQTFVSGTAAVMVALLLIPLISLYILLDSVRLKAAMLNLFPQRMQSDVERAMISVNKALSGYIYSKAAMAIFVGLSTWIVLAILRVPFAFILGFLAGVGELIPVVGPWIAFIPTSLFALSAGPVALLWFVIMTVIIQLVQNYLIAPKLMGETMNLHPLTVLLSLVIGGAMGGVLGLIIAAPAAAAIKVIFNIFVFKREERGIDVLPLDLISDTNSPADYQEQSSEI